MHDVNPQTTPVSEPGVTLPWRQAALRLRGWFGRGKDHFQE
jgi:hypothetical protein